MTLLNRRERRVLIARRKDPGAQAILDLLRKEGARLDDHEFVAALESENERLSKELRFLQQELAPQIDSFPERYEAHTIAEELRLRVEILERMRPDIEELPADLLGVVDLIERLYRDRIFFTDEARESASEASFQDVHISWRILRSIATTLFDLFGSNCNLEKEFRDRTGFELAITETSATKELAEAVRQRMVRYGDRYLFAGAHVKYGNRAPKLLRVHFTYRSGSPLIVVGHVGDHLETAGTRRGRGR